MPRLSPSLYRRVTLVAAVFIAFIIVTGAGVRLSGSGLGCPDWPTCAQDRLVAPLEYHAMVEFVNRTVTGIVSVVVILAVLGSLFRQPRRRDLTFLSLGLVAGVMGQIVLGGLVVLFHLAPTLVMAHMGVSMALLGDAVVLHHRAGRPDGAALRPVVGDNELRMARLLVAATALVIALGTVVTGAGPHAGSHNGQFVRRLPFAVHDAARLHGLAVFILVALILALVWMLRTSGAPPRVLRRAELLVAVVVAQGSLGYIQYFNGVPPVLVGIHIAGATAVWAATLSLALNLHAAIDTTGEPREARQLAASAR